MSRRNAIIKVWVPVVIIALTGCGRSEPLCSSKSGADPERSEIVDKGGPTYAERNEIANGKYFSREEQERAEAALEKARADWLRSLEADRQKRLEKIKAAYNVLRAKVMEEEKLEIERKARQQRLTPDQLVMSGMHDNFVYRHNQPDDWERFAAYNIRKGNDDDARNPESWDPLEKILQAYLVERAKSVQSENREIALWADRLGITPYELRTKPWFNEKRSKYRHHDPQDWLNFRDYYVKNSLPIPREDLPRNSRPPSYDSNRRSLEVTDLDKIIAIIALGHLLSGK